MSLLRFGPEVMKHGPSTVVGGTTRRKESGEEGSGRELSCLDVGSVGVAEKSLLV